MTRLRELEEENRRLKSCVLLPLVLSGDQSELGGEMAAILEIMQI